MTLLEKIFFFALNMKEEKEKKYTVDGYQSRKMYLFNNKQEYNKYYAENGVTVTDNDVFTYPILFELNNGKIIAMKGLCDQIISRINGQPIIKDKQKVIAN